MAISREQLQPIAVQIEKIYRRVRALERAEAADRKVGLRLADLNAPPVSRLDGVDDAIKGLRYAVWNIGLTVSAIGGGGALENLFEMVEALDPGSTRLASWLDHRWNGVPIRDGQWTA